MRRASDEARHPGCGRFENPRAAAAWSAHSHSRRVRGWIRQGYRMPWLKGRPPRPFWRRAYPTNEKQRRVLQKERDVNLQEGSWVACPVQDGDALVRSGHCISPAFCIPKKGDPEPRACVDMRIINEQARKVTAQPEGLNLIPHLADRGWYAMSCDVRKAFHCLGIDRRDWRYVTVDLGPPEGPVSVQNPRFVYCVVLPFGYTNSPGVWQRTCLSVMKRARARGVPCALWLDDILILGETAEECRRNDDIVSEEFASHGIELHPNKGQREPAQTIYHLGLDIDLKRGLFLTPPAKADRVQREAKAILCSALSQKNRRFVRARWLAQFAGLCISLYLAVPSARFRTRSLYDVLSKHQVHTRGYHHRVKLSETAIKDLRWWKSFTEHNVSRAIWRPPVTATAYVDASRVYGAGWGYELTIPPAQMVPAHGIWTRQELLKSINFLELRAVRKLLQREAPALANHVLLLWEDNQSVMYILNNLVSRSQEMQAELRLIMVLLEKYDILAHARYIRSEENPADYWSRLVDKADWQLRPDLAQRLIHRWGPRTIDLFASRTNAVCSRFCAMVPTPGAEAVDCFTISWAHEKAWINPPWSKIARVLTVLRSTPAAEATLLLPWWPSRPWWPTLMSLVDQALELPGLAEADVIPGPCCIDKPEPLRNPYWHLGLFHVPVRA